LPETEARCFNATGKFMTSGKLKDLLSRLGRTYSFLTLDEYLQGMMGERPLGRAVVLTFDDGYANNHAHAYPLLMEMGIPFAIFVATGFVDTPQVMWVDLLEYAIFTTRRSVLPPGVLAAELSLSSRPEKHRAIQLLKAHLKRQTHTQATELVKTICRDLQVDDEAPELEHVRFLNSVQIREMHEHGVVFGGHTVHHMILAREAATVVGQEVRECRRQLESFTGGPVRYFAYPNGKRQDFNDLVKQELVAAGYAASWSAIGGISRPGDDLFEIRRFPVNGQWSFAEFETRISGIVEFLRGQK
jgi:peptidoglycan/xylan/chitin deacetylase (PgdA/CDA1 family)